MDIKDELDEVFEQMKSLYEAPHEEPMRQYYYIAKCREYAAWKSREIGRALTYNTQTFGCQMNAKDSEKLSGILEKIGFTAVDTEKADFVIYNTCTVRENANSKVYGRIGYLGNLKSKNPNMMIALCGCMMQEAHVIEKIKNSYRFVDIIFGTHNIYKLAELIYQRICLEMSCKAVFEMPNGIASQFISNPAMPQLMRNDAKSSKRMVIDVWDKADKIVEDLPIERKYSFKAGVNIMFGCNNFCSYCIVPYVRGRERSRELKDIIAEIKKLAADGVVEIMLLGQNVNSYGKTLEQPVTFAELLKEVEKVERIKRIRFMTSHPKDLSDELIDVIKNSKKICRHIHLPLQSGSTSILKAMNRIYSKEDYLLLVDKIKAAIPDVSLTTDIIVGFPGETEEDFLETLDVISKVKYDSAYTFIYSKRSGTPAEALEQVDEKIAKDRFTRLLKLIQDISTEVTGRYEGKVMEVLAEEINEQDSSIPARGMLSGRLDNNLIVHFMGDAGMLGKLVNVYLKECKGFYYIGELVKKK